MKLFLFSFEILKTNIRRLIYIIFRTFANLLYSKFRNYYLTNYLTTDGKYFNSYYRDSQQPFDSF